MSCAFQRARKADYQRYLFNLRVHQADALRLAAHDKCQLAIERDVWHPGLCQFKQVLISRGGERSYKVVVNKCPFPKCQKAKKWMGGKLEARYVYIIGQT